MKSVKYSTYKHPAGSIDAMEAAAFATYIVDILGMADSIDCHESLPYFVRTSSAITASTPSCYRADQKVLNTQVFIPNESALLDVV